MTDTSITKSLLGLRNQNESFNTHKIVKMHSYNVSTSFEREERIGKSYILSTKSVNKSNQRIFDPSFGNDEGVISIDKSILQICSEKLKEMYQDLSQTEFEIEQMIRKTLIGDSDNKLHEFLKDAVSILTNYLSSKSAEIIKEISLHSETLRILTEKSIEDTRCSNSRNIHQLMQDYRPVNCKSFSMCSNSLNSIQISHPLDPKK